MQSLAKGGERVTIKHHWKINGRIYEVSKKQRQRFKKEYDRHKRLMAAKKDVTVLSLDAIEEQGSMKDVFLADLTVNVEDEIIDKLMIKKLNSALERLPDDEKQLIDLLYSKRKTIREVAATMGVSKSVLCEKKDKILRKLKIFL